jgi:hypothetical protein
MRALARYHYDRAMWKKSSHRFKPAARRSPGGYRASVSSKSAARCLSRTGRRLLASDHYTLPRLASWTSVPVRRHCQLHRSSPKLHLGSLRRPHQGMRQSFHPRIQVNLRRRPASTAAAHGFYRRFHRKYHADYKLPDPHIRFAFLLSLLKASHIGPGFLIGAYRPCKPRSMKSPPNLFRCRLINFRLHTVLHKPLECRISVKGY